MLLLTALVVALATAPAEKPVPVPVYVFTAPASAPFTDINQQQRDRAVGDLRKDLGKKKHLTVVDDPSEARLHLEVTDSGKRPTGTKNLWFGQIKEEKRPTVRVRLSVGDYTLDMESHQVAGSGHEATKGVAAAVEKWVKENRAQLAR